MATSIGDRIRTRRLLLGLSVRMAASKAGLSHASWSRIEGGKQATDNRFTIAAIAEALRCSVAELTGQPVVPADADQAEVGSAAYGLMRAVVEADLSYAPETEPLPLDQLERELDLVRDLRSRCEYVGAARRLPNLVRGLHAAAYGPARAGALRLLVMADESASFIVRYLGEPTSAVLVADRAQQAADQLGDVVMLGLAAYGRAHAATGCGLYKRALLLADTAAASLVPYADLPDALPLRGQLLLTAGFAAAALGDQAGSAARFTEAEDIAAHTGQNVDSLGLNFGPTNINFWRISMETDGGDPGRAVELARVTNPAEVPSTSRQTAYYLDTGRALARIQRDPEAVRMLSAAERIAPQRVRANPLVVETARMLLDRSQRNAVGVELRGLAERVGVDL